MDKEYKTKVNSITAMLLLLVVVIAGIIILNKKTQIEQLSLQNENLSVTIEKRDSLVNEMSNTFDEIEESLSFVRNKRGQLVLTSPEGKKNRKEVLVADIKLMDEMLEESSKKIEELDKKLKESGIEIQSFKSKIEKLNKYVAEQNNNIKQLKAEIEKRDYKIAKMDTELAQLQVDIASKDDSIVSKTQIIDEKTQTIIEKDIEINRAYFAVGTHKELVNKGVLSKESGILGIWKNTTINDGINESYFTKLDIREVNQFPINTRKAKLISEHPTNSYRLVKENDEIAYLEIENPQEFWKLSKYAVVETKK